MCIRSSQHVRVCVCECVWVCRSNAAGIRAVSCGSVRQRGVITRQMFLKDKRINGPSKGQSSVPLPVCVCLSFCCSACPTSLFIHLDNDGHLCLHFSFIRLYLHSLILHPFPSPSFSSPLLCVWINDTQNHKGLGALAISSAHHSPRLHTHTALTQIMSIHAKPPSSSPLTVAYHSPDITWVAKKPPLAFAPLKHWPPWSPRTRRRFGKTGPRAARWSLVESGAVGCAVRTNPQRKGGKSRPRTE